MGLTIIPLSDRFTRSTSEACSSIDRFLWITPRPPCCAIAMARRDSVTVSIAALTIGTFSRILRVSRVLTSTCVGSTVECRGTSRTSSKVSAVAGPCVGIERHRRSWLQVPFSSIEASLPASVRFSRLHVMLPLRGISCTSCRFRTDTGRFGRPSARLAEWSSRRRRLHRRARAAGARPPAADRAGAAAVERARKATEGRCGSASQDRGERVRLTGRATAASSFRTGRSHHRYRTISSSTRSFIAWNSSKLSFLYSTSGSR